MVSSAPARDRIGVPIVESRDDKIFPVPAAVHDFAGWPELNSALSVAILAHPVSYGLTSNTSQNGPVLVPELLQASLQWLYTTPGMGPVRVSALLKPINDIRRGMIGLCAYGVHVDPDQCLRPGGSGQSGRDRCL